VFRARVFPRDYAAARALVRLDDSDLQPMKLEGRQQSFKRARIDRCEILFQLLDVHADCELLARDAVLFERR
jgi:hypothetical protein